MAADRPYVPFDVGRMLEYARVIGPGLPATRVSDAGGRGPGCRCYQGDAGRKTARLGDDGHGL